MSVAPGAASPTFSPNGAQFPLSQAEAEASAHQMLEQGQTFTAYDLARGALARFPSSVRLKQAAALALLRAGALAEAQALLEGLCPDPPDGSDAAARLYTALREVLARMAEATTPGGPPPPELRDALDGLLGALASAAAPQNREEPGEETLGLLARVYKGLWLRSGATEDARRARDAYTRGFRASRGPWTGINAATLSWICGERDQAAALAGQVLGIIARTPMPADDADRYWRFATEGEALLLLCREREAADAYARAAACAGRRYASVAASRRQLDLLAAHGLPAPDARQSLQPPSVVVFVGHMLDRADRDTPRFPPSLEETIRREIGRHLDALDARIGFCSAACGSDLLFIEAMQERGAEVHVVLPYARRDFLRQSVAWAGPCWVTRFEQALKLADSVKYVTEESLLGDDIVFGLMGRMLLGQATLVAGPLDAAPTLLAVWDGQPGGGTGGTADLVAGWPDPARLRVIPLAASGGGAPPEPAAPQPANVRAEASPAVRRQIKTLLFADVVGYSRLQEDAMPAFMFSFLQRVAEGLPRRPRFTNTWGDAIFALMDDATPMAEYAMALQDVVCDTDWTGFGLPSGMSVRIGLHAGPVFEGTDPITGLTNYYGSHVNRAARIEPVTVPGNVYASEQFAALLTAEQAGAARAGRPPAFACEYIGTLALAKDYGLQPTYHLRRAAPVAFGGASSQ